MSPRQSDASGQGGPAFSRELLALLGLPPGATADDIATAHADLTEFLSSAPESVQPWAQRQLAAVDAAMTLLRQRGLSLAPDAASATSAPASPDAGEKPATGTKAATEAKAAPVAGTAAEPEALDAADFEDEDDRPVLRKPSGSTQGSKPGGARNLIMAATLAILILGIILGVYWMGGQPSAAPSMPPSADASASTRPLDQALVDSLKRKVEADPKDVASMRALAQLYFTDTQYGEAAAWQRRVLEVLPKDVDARLALGVSLAYQNQLTEAEKVWLEAIEIDPKRVEVYLNLGFLYISKSPPDIPKAEAAWKKVIELDPQSTYAQTARAHLDRLKNTTASPGVPAPGTPLPSTPGR